MFTWGLSPGGIISDLVGDISLGVKGRGSMSGGR